MTSYEVVRRPEVDPLADARENGGRSSHRLWPARSTVPAILVRTQLNKLSHINRVTGNRCARNEHDYPGSLLHVEVT